MKKKQKGQVFEDYNKFVRLKKTQYGHRIRRKSFNSLLEKTTKNRKKEENTGTVAFCPDVATTAIKCLFFTI
jgi:hypothetical protein